jgi:vancomycin resistance protein YoaR
MANQENQRGTGRSNTEVDKAFRQASGGTPARRPSARQIAERKKAARNRKIAIISICSVILVVLIGLIIGMIVYANRDTDDGKILDNVVAGGVNLGGMTVEEAKNALHLATDNTFPRKDLVVKLPDATINFSPAETGAKLDVDAVVEAAYNYGRTGSDAENKKAQQNASTTIHTIALLPFLDLDLRYIQQTINDFCTSYSSTMTQPSVVLRGERPAFDPEYPDLPVIHQTMVITLGTPDYKLDAGKLYDRVLDAYSLNEMEVSYQAPTQTEPQKLTAQELFAEYCLAAEDAILDDVTFEVTPEVYGYGFDIEAIQKRIDKAQYGETIEITLGFIEPDITAKDLTENLFQDLLATYTCTMPNATDGWINNLLLACEAISGTVIKEDEEFSFNQIVGRLTASKGYQKAPGYRSGVETDILGAGVEQVASALYYCVLMSDLEVLERHNNGYVVEYTDLGLDACISWGSQDLRFRNDTKAPIRIVAIAEAGSVTINVFGTDNRQYDIKLETEILKQHDPDTIYQVMDKDNVMGYEDGKVLISGITGYDVAVHKIKLHKQTGNQVSKDLVNTSNYNKRDQKEVQIESDPVETPDPSDPVDPPSDNTDPSFLESVVDFFDKIF